MSFAAPVFREDREDVLLALIDSTRLGALIINTEDGIALSHIPFVYKKDDGILHLISHVHRGNPIGAEGNDGQDVVVSFLCDHAYIHPGWYPSKAEHGRAVPTYNYVSVEARGKVRLLTEPGVLKTMLMDLTARTERDMSKPWQVDDAPPSYIDRLINGIVGVEVCVTHLSGIQKLSQDKAEDDFQGVIEGLRQHNVDSAVAERMDRTAKPERKSP